MLSHDPTLHEGRFPRHRLVTVLVAVAFIAVAAGWVVFSGPTRVSVEPERKASATPPPPPPDDLKKEVSYAELIQKEKPTPPPQVIKEVAPDPRVAELEKRMLALEEENRALRAQKQPPAKPAAPKAPDAEAQRREQERREARKRALEEQKAGRESPLVAIAHEKQVVEEEAKGGGVRGLGSTNTIFANKFINCQVKQVLNSEAPGEIVVWVTQPVYDSLSGAHVLIPAGSEIGMTYKSAIFGESRVTAATADLNNLQMPNGMQVDLGQRPLMDVSGQTGLTGAIDRHIGSNLLSFFLLSSLRAATTGVMVGGQDVGERVGATVAGGMAQQSSQQISRALNTNPTITVASGEPCALRLNKPLELPVYEAEVRR